MKLIGICPSTLTRPERNEVLDALDVRWPQLLTKIKTLPVILPNEPEIYPQLLDRIAPDGFLLSGGGEGVAVSGVWTQRDLCEQAILHWAQTHHRPVFGVCRGFQVMLAQYGTELVQSDGHVDVEHHLDGFREGSVNSFHNYVAYRASPTTDVLARALDGTIEAATFSGGRVMGTMWHPERFAPFQAEDLSIIKHHLESTE